MFAAMIVHRYLLALPAENRATVNCTYPVFSSIESHPILWKLSHHRVAIRTRTRKQCLTSVTPNFNITSVVSYPPHCTYIHLSHAHFQIYYHESSSSLHLYNFMGKISRGQATQQLYIDTMEPL